MALFNLGNIKQRAEDNYNKQYLSNIMGTYTDMGGRFNFDEATGIANYNAPSRPLPPLSEIWIRYAKRARSRGVKADFMTFKKWYS